MDTGNGGFVQTRGAHPVSKGRENEQESQEKKAKNVMQKNSTEYFMSPVVTTLNDVNVRLIDCDDENVTWRYRIDLATDAVGNVSDNCDDLMRRSQDSSQIFKQLLGENKRLQNRMEAMDEMMEVAIRHRFVPEVDDREPGYMVKRLEASLPPGSFD